MSPRSYTLSLACLVLSASVLAFGCRSLDKATVEERLLALPKNAPLAGHLQTLEREIELGGKRVRASFRHLRAGTSGPGRPVVVLVHGTPSSLVTWSSTILGQGGLAEDCDVFAIEMVGHGMTRTELESYSFASGAEWIRAFLVSLDLRDVTLVGNSYGGEFVWRAALDDPERIARVVLMSSSGFEREDDEWLPEEVQMRQLSLAKIGWILNSRERVRSALAPHFQTPVADEHVEEIYLVCANRDNWHAMIDLARDENGTRAPELARLRQPTLLLWGAQDVAYRPERFAALFERTIPDSRLVLLEGAGHYPQEERPAEVARAIAAFARGG